MPKLFDLLSQHSDKDALLKIQKQAIKNKAEKRKKEIKKKRFTKPSERKAPPPAASLLFDFVAVDFETTGLDAKDDRITEIGAVRFIDGKADGEFCRLINPCKPIPQNIVVLTGITNEQIQKAPQFHEVADEFLAFVGSLPICGHQINFDYTFLNAELKRAGKEYFKNRQFDTAGLSRLLLDGLSGYSLGHVAETLGVTLENAHRALSDAQASGEIALLLIPRIYTLSFSVRQRLARFAPASILKTLLVKSLNNGSSNRSVAPDRPLTISLPSSPKLSAWNESPVSVGDETITRYFEKDGALSQQLPGYMMRQSQLDMALHVTRALNQQTCLIAEAGTGTGKSLAYLLPAAQWAYKNNCRIMIATHTKNLQDQLMAKDLPVVSNIVGSTFRYSVLKGRSNYLCRYRWNKFTTGQLGNISPFERLNILPLVRWAEQTQTGDIEEQSQFNVKWHAKIWSLVSADSHECHGKRCSHFGRCFLQQARQRAQGSHIVVINHALFFAEICAESSFLGKTGSIIFDEAHHLPSCGYRYLRVDLDSNRVNRYVDLVSNILQLAKTQISETDAVECVRNLKKVTKRLRRNGTQFLEELGAWATAAPQQKTQTVSEGKYQVIYRDNPFGSFSGLSGFLLVLDDCKEVLQSLLLDRSDAKDTDDDLQSEIATCVDKTSQLKADCLYLTKGVTDDHVFWIEGDIQKRWIKLCGVPLDISTILASVWDRIPGSRIFTSATISASDSIEYFTNAVGLADYGDEYVTFKKFSSPFFKEQLLCCAVNAPLLPDAQGYDAYVAEVITDLCTTVQKNILVLFTAHTMLQSVYEQCKKTTHFPAEYTLLAQGISGSRAALLETFQNTPKTVLLGSSSFWEGIDAPGRACEIVLIPRLPFLVPTHPVIQALAQRYKEKYGDSFFRYSVPEAIIRFRQGCGRLIRTVDDTGALIVLDNRIITKNYGKLFIRSLDTEFDICQDLNQMREKVASFLK